MHTRDQAAAPAFHIHIYMYASAWDEPGRGGGGGKRLKWDERANLSRERPLPDRTPDIQAFRTNVTSENSLA